LQFYIGKKNTYTRQSFKFFKTAEKYNYDIFDSEIFFITVLKLNAELLFILNKNNKEKNIFLFSRGP